MRIKSLVLGGAAALALAGSALSAGPAFAEPSPAPSPPLRTSAPADPSGTPARCMTLEEEKRVACLTAALRRLSMPRAAKCERLEEEREKLKCLVVNLRELSAARRPAPPVATPGTPNYTG